MRELQGQIKDTSVIVEMDNSRTLNMDDIVAEVKAQYEEIAAANRKDTEGWYQQKVQHVDIECYLSHIIGNPQDQYEAHTLQFQIVERTIFSDFPIFRAPQ